VAVIAWIVEAGWRACVDAAARHTPPNAEIELLHVTDPDVAEVAHGAYAGLLGRGDPHRDPGSKVEDLASTAAKKLLDDAAARLGRPCRTVERTGRIESEVLAAAVSAELLIVARDGDTSHRGPRSIGHASRYVIDHAPCPVLLVWPGAPPASVERPPHHGPLHHGPPDQAPPPP
jgi:nucleotide-binding universal stress UspA family protein